MRKQLLRLERDIRTMMMSLSPQSNWNAHKALLDAVAEEYLKLEKYVHVNFTGFYKILKKHDKVLSSNPCKAFYMARLHEHGWTRGDFTDVMLTMSKLYELLRGEEGTAGTVAEGTNQQVRHYCHWFPVPTRCRGLRFARRSTG